MTNNTKIIHSGREPFKHDRTINPPIYASSSLVFKTLKDIDEAATAYGRHGTQTVRYLEDLVKVIEAGTHAMLFPSGLAAITTTILGCVCPGDHLLMSSSAYEPTKAFVTEFLAKFNIEYDFYPAGIDAEIANHIKPNTKAIFIESPASQSFEIDEIDSVVQICKQRNIISIFDNTYSGGYFFKPLNHGIDIVVQSCSKFFSGHSDIIMGCMSTSSDKLYNQIKHHYKYLGLHVSPRDCYLVQRGIRTLTIRLDKHYQNSLEVANWLMAQPEVAEVLYPALPSNQYHARFKKYFSGASGLFSFYFTPEISRDQARNFVETLKYFHIGFGWGGYESLVMMFRNVNNPIVKNPNRYLIRFFIGLEEPEDLIDDIKQALRSIV
jgi:cysteine-S-conjugate beta-lyase